MIQKDEFIDLIVNDCMVDFRRQHSKEYESINEFVKLFRMVEYELEKSGTSRQDLYLLSAMTQLNELFQSSIILLEKGLKDSAFIVIRSILELIFKIIEVIRNESFIDDMSLKQDYENVKLLKDISKNKFFDMVPEEKLLKFIEKYENNIDDQKEPKFTVSKLAQKNGFYKAYIIYRLQCDYTHQTNFVIESKINVTDKGFIVNGNFKLDDFKMSIAWLISITSIIFPVIIDEYIGNQELKIYFNKFLKNFEVNFSDLIE